MSNSAKSAWPASGAFSFMPFPMPGAAPAAAPGMASGMDMLRNFWGALPGSTQVPGFLVPTMDVDELDRRIADLRAAETWVEVNLNMLRATIQGLEVQRHTIAALQSLSAVPDAAMGVMPDAKREPGREPKPDLKPDAAMADQWLGYLQDQFAKVAQAALAVSVPPPAAAGKKSAHTPRKRAATKAGR